MICSKYLTVRKTRPSSRIAHVCFYIRNVGSNAVQFRAVGYVTASQTAVDQNIEQNKLESTPYSVYSYTRSVFCFKSNKNDLFKIRLRQHLVRVDLNYSLAMPT